MSDELYACSRALDHSAGLFQGGSIRAGQLPPRLESASFDRVFEAKGAQNFGRVGAERYPRPDLPQLAGVTSGRMMTGASTSTSTSPRTGPAGPSRPDDRFI